MKYCPVCETRYDEEIMRFCTKDGTPLVDEEAPNFIAMPSEDLESDAEDDIGAETVIRRRVPESEITNVEPRTGETSQRMVIPTSETVEQQQQVRAKQTAAYQQPPPPQRTSTAAVVLLTIFGTLVVLGAGAGVYWLLSGQNRTAQNTNVNVNTNQDTNLNTDLGIDNSLFNANVDLNANANVNTNVNANANISPTPTRTPSPTPTKTPTPTPTPDEDDDNTNTENTNTGGAPVNARPTATPTRTPTPSTPTNSAPVNVGNMNSRAVSLAKPVYPPQARQVRAGGQVPVLITVDESGRVISARATGGHPLLRQAAEAAARSSRFTPARIGGQPVKSTGTVIYNFVSN
jgi:TonB family protein